VAYSANVGVFVFVANNRSDDASCGRGFVIKARPYVGQMKVVFDSEGVPAPDLPGGERWYTGGGHATGADARMSVLKCPGYARKAWVTDT